MFFYTIRNTYSPLTFWAAPIVSQFVWRVFYLLRYAHKRGNILCAARDQSDLFNGDPVLILLWYCRDRNFAGKCFVEYWEV